MMSREVWDMVRTIGRHGRTRRDERGVETIEWIGMAAAVVALMVGVAAFLSGGGGADIGQAIVDALTGFISQLRGG